MLPQGKKPNSPEVQEGTLAQLKNAQQRGSQHSARATPHCIFPDSLSAASQVATLSHHKPDIMMAIFTINKPPLITRVIPTVSWSARVLYQEAL